MKAEPNDLPNVIHGFASGANTKPVSFILKEGGQKAAFQADAPYFSCQMSVISEMSSTAFGALQQKAMGISLVAQNHT